MMKCIQVHARGSESSSTALDVKSLIDTQDSFR